jgi:hypothetical protein
MPKIRWQPSFAFPETPNKYRGVELKNAVSLRNCSNSPWRRRIAMIKLGFFGHFDLDRPWFHTAYTSSVSALHTFNDV